MASIEERKGTQGKKSYRAKVRLKGHPPQTATFNRKTDATRWVQSTESALREGRYLPIAEAKKHTLSELLERYRSQIVPGKKSQRTLLVMLKWWQNTLGDYAIAEISPALIAEYRDQLLIGNTPKGTVRSPSTVVRYLALLSHAFTIAVKEWGWTDNNPVLRVSKPKEPRGRVRYLDQEECSALLTACQESSNAYVHAIVLVALATGMRRSEILSLRWEDIDFDRNTVVIHETKNGERRQVPLARKAKAVLQELSKIRHIKSNLLFPSKKNPRQPIDIRRPWENALAVAQIKDFRFHDLRHTAASYLAMSGASQIDIAEILGHKTLQMVKRYSHLSDSHTHTVISSMSEKFLNDA